MPNNEDSYLVTMVRDMKNELLKQTKSSEERLTVEMRSNHELINKSLINLRNEVKSNKENIETMDRRMNKMEEQMEEFNNPKEPMSYAKITASTATPSFIKKPSIVFNPSKPPVLIQREEAMDVERKVLSISKTIIGLFPIVE